MTRDDWLTRHAYLQPVADLGSRVDAALAQLQVAGAAVPSWDDYTGDFHEGVPLLQSPGAAIDLEPSARAVAALVANLAAAGALASGLEHEARDLADELGRDATAAHRIAAWLLGEEGLAPSHPGLLRYLGWTVMARTLRAVVDAYASWRDEEHWLRAYCPTCGSLPAMAQLVGSDPGRKRFLRCGCCRTRWQFGRTGCPFCKTDVHRLAVVAVQGEAGLRIDYCESCRGYLKTYDGQGDEAVLLEDWTSLHLDLLAHDRGLKRLAVSLYALDPALDR
jgi:FdhE protein